METSFNVIFRLSPTSKRFLIFPFVSFFFLITITCLRGQHAEVDSLFKKYSRSDSPGIAVSVSKDGGVIYQKGFGMANLEYGIPISTKTKFHVASLSKQFTAYLILKLEDEGLLTLEDDVRMYIPELPNYGYKIEIKHLLTHSSGIRDQWRLLEMAGWRLDDVIKTEQIFRLITSQTELNFVPGDKFKYSNSGYTLLAIIIERLTDVSFAEYAKKNIFDPLEMKDSFFYDDHEVMIPNRAYSYKQVENRLKKSNLNFATVGPTSLFTTIEDMNKWTSNFELKIIGNEAIFKSMRKKAKKNDGSTSSFAKGLFVRKYKGHEMIYHSGSDAGYRLYFARFPKLGYDFTLFANASYISAYEEIFKLVDYYLKDKYPKNGKKDNLDKEFKYKEERFIKLVKSEMEAFEGRYFDREKKEFWEVEVRGDTLFCEGGLLEKATHLHPVGQSNFKIKGSAYDISVNFIENDYDEPVLEFRIPDIMWLWLVRVVPIDSSEYLGTYYNKDLSVEYSLIRQGDDLVLRHQKLDDIKILPINEAYFSSNNRNFSNIRFQRDSDGKISAFIVSNGGVDKMPFYRK